MSQHLITPDSTTPNGIDPKPDSSTSRPKRFTLRVTLVSAFSGLALLGGVFLSTVTSLKVGEFIREELRIRLADTASIMATQLNGDLHSKIRMTEDESSPDYLTLQKNLREMKSRGTAITFAYTMRRNPDGKPVFIVDSTDPGPDFSHVGDVYSTDNSTLNRALNATPGTKTAFVSESFVTDEWGTFLSAFIPIYTSDGNMDGVLGIDVSAANVIEHEFQYKLIVWATSAGVVLLVLPLGLLFARRIRQPLAQLAVEMAKVKQFDLDSEISIKSRVLEIESMVNELENMKRGLRSFRKYVPAELVRQLIELGVDAKPGGTMKELTIFFSDIAGFTALSEQLSPEALVNFLSEYLNSMNACLLKHNSTVDKYIGDGVMAFWGAPRDIAQHALYACRAALECQDAINALNKKWKLNGLNIDFHTRIGINTGDVIVGNMGSDERMSYTVIGDNVNLTSRIESINKYYETRILITESTYQQVKHEMVTRHIDRVVMAGKTIPISLYELIGSNSKVSPAARNIAQHYEEALTLYQQRQFEDAATVFESLLSKNPDDRPSAIMLGRCQQYITTPPIKGWKGEFIFSQK